MKEYLVRGASWKDVCEKKFNIYMGISLGNKWFGEENLIEAIKLGLELTRDRFCILIADEIHSINYAVRDKKGYESAGKKAIKKGDEILETLNKVLKSFSEEEISRIEVIRWNDIVEYRKNMNLDLCFLNSLFEKNEVFRNSIKKIVLGHLNEQDCLRFSDEDIGKLCSYVLEELPELFQGFLFNGILYNAFLYPFDNPLTRLIEEIQNGEKFSEINSELKQCKCVFISMEEVK